MPSSAKTRNRVKFFYSCSSRVATRCRSRIRSFNCDTEKCQTRARGVSDKYVVQKSVERDDMTCYSTVVSVLTKRPVSVLFPLFNKVVSQQYICVFLKSKVQICRLISTDEQCIFRKAPQFLHISVFYIHRWAVDFWKTTLHISVFYSWTWIAGIVLVNYLWRRFIAGKGSVVTNRILES